MASNDFRSEFLTGVAIKEIGDFVAEVIKNGMPYPLENAIREIVSNAVKVERERCRVIALRAYLNTDSNETQRFLDGAVENGQRIARSIDPSFI